MSGFDCCVREQSLEITIEQKYIEKSMMLKRNTWPQKKKTIFNQITSDFVQSNSFQWNINIFIFTLIGLTNYLYGFIGIFLKLFTRINLLSWKFLLFFYFYAEWLKALFFLHIHIRVCIYTDIWLCIHGMHEHLSVQLEIFSFCAYDDS